MRRHPNGTLELLEKPKAIKAHQLGKIFKRELVSYMRLHEISHTLQLLMRQSPLNDLGRRMPDACKQGLEQFEHLYFFHQRLLCWLSHAGMKPEKLICKLAILEHHCGLRREMVPAGHFLPNACEQ